MTNGSRVTVSISEAELEAIVSRGVEDGISKVFVTLGIDLGDTESRAQWHKERGWVRDRVNENSLSFGIRAAFRNNVVGVILSGLIAWWIAHKP